MESSQHPDRRLTGGRPARAARARSDQIAEGKPHAERKNSLEKQILSRVASGQQARAATHCWSSHPAADCTSAVGADGVAD